MVPPLPAFNKLLEVCSKRNDVMETVHQVCCCCFLWRRVAAACSSSLLLSGHCRSCIMCMLAAMHAPNIHAHELRLPVFSSTSLQHLTSKLDLLQLVEMMSGSALQPNEETHKHLEACFAYHNLQRSS